MNVFFEAMERLRFRMNVLVKLTLALFILTYSTPAFSGQLEIEIGPGWMKGKADGAAMGEVLTKMTHKAGYAIYIDEQLQETPVTFNIQDKLAHEKAIKRIVRPHSYAVVFGGEDKDSISNILEVWIFRKGQQFSASYVDLRTASTAVSGTASSGTHSASAGSREVSEGSYVDPKKVVKRELYVKRNAYGGPLFTYRDDPKKGPDYRPNAHEMRQAYQRYQMAKRRAERRRAEALRRNGRQEYEKDRENYRTHRNQAIQQYIKERQTRN